MHPTFALCLGYFTSARLPASKRDKSMISVEILIAEDGLVQAMETMRTWLDHMRFTAATFRCTFVANGMVLRVDFPAEDEARAFAQAFSGKLVARPLDAIL